MNFLNLGRVVGLSAYELAVQTGYTGTLEEWLQSLRYDHSDEYEEFTRTIEDAREEIISSKTELEGDMTLIRNLVITALSDIDSKKLESIESIKAEKTKAIGDIVESKDASVQILEQGKESALSDIASALSSAKGDIDGVGTAWKQIIESIGLLTREEMEKASEQIVQSANAQMNQSMGHAVSEIEKKGNEVLKEINDQMPELKSDISALNSEIADVKTDVEELAESLWKMEISGKLDGTAKTYHRTMKTWFNERGVNAMSPIGITDLCEKWYRITRDEWNGWTTFSKASTSSEGVRGGDNADMVCEASTDTIENRDDFAGLPLFAVSTVNWELDADGDIVITAIKGISSSFEQDNPDKYVGVMQMSGYTYIRETDDDYTIGYASDNTNAGEKCAPLPESIRLDGTSREFVVHAKYMSSTVGGKMTSCSGMIPTSFNSHNKLISLSANNGDMYSASTVTDWAFLVLMTMIKYASMTQDRKNQGCVNYNYQYTAALAESGVSRVLLSDAQTAKLVVGSCVVIGSGGATDRTDVRTRDISSGCTITSIEDVTVGDVIYKAVYVDADPFDTTTDTIISTWHWKTGTNDHVLGNDGSITSPSSGVYPAMIQGIEYSMGGYEVLGDVILSIEDGYYVPYIARRKEYQAASLNDNMHKSTLQSAQPAGDGWNYIKRLSYDGEIFFGTDTTGATSYTYTKDAFYKNGTGTVSGLREWLAFGSLTAGAANGGLSYLHGSGLSYAYWYCLARLSPNGNRGELAA